MKNLKGTIAVTVFTLFVGVGSAHAVDILNTPPEVKERGVEWTQPEMTLSGHGKLKSYGMEYRGDISCDVKVDAIRDRHNKVKIESEDGSIDIKAKSNTGTVTLSNCTVTDRRGTVNELDSPIVFSNGEVKVKIKEYGTGFDGAPTFDKMEIKGRYDKRDGRRHSRRHGKRDRTVLKMKLYNGTIAPIVVPEVTPVPTPQPVPPTGCCLGTPR